MKVSKLGRHHCATVSEISQSEFGSGLEGGCWVWDCEGEELVVVVVVEGAGAGAEGARRSFRRALKPWISSAEAGR